ncbi:DNA topoisomerase 2-like [Triticum aestivum]|uniref:DNA topoisomerase 2-like n=1 Tax=Triticum aestivum TaxID=4565 RepID=UPI001D0230CC|nr:DNA topoisomerase 2-like [Triticum aestivum]
MLLCVYNHSFQGGEDAAEALFIYTRLQPITRFIFPKDDDVLLNYLSEAGKSIEPSWYMPIIPMVLVNGSGIGTGSSSYVPNYNPRDIIANLKRLLNEEAVVPMEPWYKGFKGSVKKTRSKAAGATYAISGVIEKVDDTKLRITELPIRCWTNDYKEFLEYMKLWEEPAFLEECQSRCDHASVEFEVILSEQNMNIAKQEGLEKKFKLTTTIETTKMHLLDSDGKIRKYNTLEDILKEFFKLRLEYYWRRKAVMLKNIGKELLKPKNQVRFILAVISGDIVVNNRKRSELFLELKQKGYQPFPQKKVTANEVDEESNYEYLLAMPIGNLTLEKVQELLAEQKKLEDEHEFLGNATPEILWLRDLDALEKELDVLDAKFEAEQEETRRKRENYFKDEKASKAAPKRRRPKKTAAKSQKTNLAGNDEDFETKPAAQMKRPPKKASAPVGDDEDEAFELKDRLAVYNLGSSSEHSAMETETTKEHNKKGKKGRNEPSKRGTAKKTVAPLTGLSGEDIAVPIPESEDKKFTVEEAQVEKKSISQNSAIKTEGQQEGKKGRNGPSKRGAVKKAMAPLTELSREDDDNKFAVEEVQVEKNSSGTEPAAKKPKKATIGKRASAQNNSSAPSPEKKARKKSGSVAQAVASASTTTEDAEAPLPSGSSDQPVALRRSARHRKA